MSMLKTSVEIRHQKITSEKQLQDVMQEIDLMTSKENLTEDEQKYIFLLSALVAQYTEDFKQSISKNVVLEPIGEEDGEKKAW